jgi:hypothetical protein
MLFLIGTFGLNFPIFISTMAVRVFHTDASGYGLLSVDHGRRNDFGSAPWRRLRRVQVAPSLLSKRLHQKWYATVETARGLRSA